MLIRIAIVNSSSCEGLNPPATLPRLRRRPPRPGAIRSRPRYRAPALRCNKFPRGRTRTMPPPNHQHQISVTNSPPNRRQLTDASPTPHLRQIPTRPPPTHRHLITSTSLPQKHHHRMATISSPPHHNQITNDIATTSPQPKHHHQKWPPPHHRLTTTNSPPTRRNTSPPP